MMDDPLGASCPFQYSIPADPFDPIKEGIGLGAKAALVLAGLYTLMVPLFMITTEWNTVPTENLRDFWAVGNAILDFYMGAVMVAGLSLVLGGVPALVMGVIGGGLIGWTFRFIKTPMSTPHAIHYGFWVSLLLLVVRIGLLGGSLNDTLNDQIMWLIWFAPNLIAFFGFWWVAVKINERIPIP